MIIIHGIQSHDAEKWWPVVADWCQRALDRGGALLLLEDLVEGVAQKKMQLWIAFDIDTPKGVIITQVDEWKRGKILSAFIVAGEEMDKWLVPFEDTLTRYAKSIGCTHLFGESRKGWERVLKPLGWEAPSVTYMKRL